MGIAQPDEILVSETTRALAEAAGLAFEDRGFHKLKGFPDERRLSAYVGTGALARASRRAGHLASFPREKIRHLEKNAGLLPRNVPG
jgi:hypothetical protein